MSARRGVLALVAAVLALAACGHDPVSGNVIGRDHRAAYDWVYEQPIYITTCSGKPTICTQHLSSFIPIVEHEPERWRLHIHTQDGDKGKNVWVTVSQSTYDAKANGAFFQEPKS